MNCSVCGMEMKRGAKFCSRCGAGAGADRLHGSAQAHGPAVSRDMNIEVRQMPGGHEPQPEMLAQLIREAGVDISPDELRKAMRGEAAHTGGGANASFKFNVNVVHKEIRAGDVPADVTTKTFTFSKSFDLKKLIYIVAAAFAAGAAVVLLLIAKS